MIKENLQSYKDTIPWTDLPATLKDAAIATYRIGLRYLWIDSMCIIQDHPDDRKNEIRRMAHVYTHAHFTIVAMRGRSAGDGFLHARPLPSGASSLRYQSTTDVCHWITLYYRPALKSENQKVLETRG